MSDIIRNSLLLLVVVCLLPALEARALREKRSGNDEIYRNK
jgi:hypothetical protein